MTEDQHRSKRGVGVNHGTQELHGEDSEACDFPYLESRV